MLLMSVINFQLLHLLSAAPQGLSLAYLCVVDDFKVNISP